MKRISDFCSPFEIFFIGLENWAQLEYNHGFFDLII